MRFLKNKISLKPDFNDEDSDFDCTSPAESDFSVPKTAVSENSDSSSVKELILPLRKPRQHPPCADGNSKNIVKNYGRALCSFAISKIAAAYLERIIWKNKWDSSIISGFVKFINSNKKAISSIESVRKLLVGNKEDDTDMLNYKKMFKEISIIFLKFFAVNWIFGGKLLHKKAHLEFRFKMLRRVQNPEHFTYLKSSAR